ncbi:MAG: inositol monophosphatase [Alphaproteobacteria bacterium CG_4_10_14_0_2_um_filter_63_37]|nr:MAG: inositol monophosphatase [Proteobacteria bacterium CG1_02_64_396]PJA24196.1 MAG: inositol monophosphatase [Alphaproteobacteria bacterium CG_4_10_14_0_2_um_filter_63_37]
MSLLPAAVRAARAAGAEIRRSFGERDRFDVAKKGPQDFVTSVDRKCEAIIRETLLAAYPGHAILGEEEGLKGANDAAITWVVDPLDGTTNFIHGLPIVSVSIAAVTLGKVVTGVVFDPIHDELFTAERGSGAQLNNRRLRLSPETKLRESVLATGFPFKKIELIEPYMPQFRAMLPRSIGVRRMGSAAIDLCYTAAGRFGGFWELGLAPWDIAAGTLILQEAGGFVTDLEGGSDFLRSGNVVGGAPAVHREMLEVLAQVRAGQLGQA